MPGLTLAIGQLKITPLFWSLLLTGIFSSFSFWRKLKDDYKEEEIFSLSLFIFVFSLIFFWLAFFLVNNARLALFSFFLGAIFAVKAWTFRFKINVWEILDALVLPWLFFLFFGGMGLFLKTANFLDLEFSLISAVGFAVLGFSQKRYRSFAWYKSGKIGFLFWEVSLVVFSLFSILAFFRRDALYWERFILVLLSLLSAGVLYYRSERDARNDLKIFFDFKKWQK